MNGAKIFENSKVTRILVKDGRAVGVETTDGTIHADRVVIAASRQALKRCARARAFLVSRLTSMPTATNSAPSSR